MLNGIYNQGSVESEAGHAYHVMLEECAISDDVRHFPLTSLPLVSKEHVGKPFHWMLTNRVRRSLLSLLMCVFSNRMYCQISDGDIPRIVDLINKIARESSWLPEHRAFLIHSFMASILAYRDHRTFQSRDFVVTLPVWIGGELTFKACRLDDDLDFCNGARVRIFVPLDGKGSPIYLFHGTVFWGGAFGITVSDDFNPLGIGEEIRQGARRHLKAVLERHHTEYGERAVAIGHSLGGLIATGLAVDLPHLVDKVFAFGPPRPSASLLNRWQRTQGRAASLPDISTFFGSFSNLVDPVIYAGDGWIGRVFCVEHQRHLDPFSRHTVVLPKRLIFTISELEVATLSRHHFVWRLMQRLGASAMYSLLAPAMTFKRLLL